MKDCAPTFYAIPGFIKQKNYVFCMNWEIKCNLGSGGHCEPLSGVSEGPGGKALGKFTIFSLKLK